MSTSISFNGNSLQTSSILTSDTDHDAPPEKELSFAQIANRNKSVISRANYPHKVINVSGSLVASSVSAMDSLIDTFKSYLLGKNKNLDIGHAGSTRRYIATVQGRPDIDRERGMTIAEFSVAFLCAEAFGKSTAETPILSATGRTASNYADDFTFEGTAPAQFPVYEIFFDDITDGENAFVLLGNANTGQQIVIQRTWADDDVLEVDTFNETVKVNGVEVAFSGAFPVFELGAQTLTYADSFTARDFDIDIGYYKLYQ